MTVEGRAAARPSLERTLLRVLERDARALSADRQIPIDLNALLAELGISLVSRDLGGGARKAHGLLRRVDGTWQVLINPSLGTARQRSTIAHELGHYVVETRIGFRPTSVREYWMLEAFCQRFAAELLSPSAAAVGAMGSVPRTPSEAIDAVALLARTMELSLEAAARRLIELSSEPIGLMAIRLEPEARRGRRRASILWSHSQRPWIVAPRGKAIRKDSALSGCAADAALLSRGGRTEFSMADGRTAVIERRTSRLALVASLLG